MYIDPHSHRRAEHTMRSERFDRFGGGPSLRLTMLGFAAALAILLGAAIVLPPSTTGILASNAITAAP